MLRPAVVKALAERMKIAEEYERAVAQAFEATSNREASVPNLAGLMAFLAEAEAPPSDLDEVAILVELADERAWGAEDMLTVLNAVIDVRMRSARLLESALGDPATLLHQYRYTLKGQATSAASSRQRDADRIEDFVLRRPGLYMAQLHRQLLASGFEHSYGTLLARIRELEESKRLLTVGVRQGIKRYCFPHPDHVDRSKYYGHDLAFRGNLGEKLTNQFDEDQAPYDVYYVNSAMRPVLLLLPWKMKVAADEVLEGFGTINDLSQAFEAFGVAPKQTAKVPEVREVLRPHRLFRREKGEVVPVKLPQYFR